MAWVGTHVTDFVTVRYHHVGTAKKWTSVFWVACARLAIFARYRGRCKNKTIQARYLGKEPLSLSPQPLRVFCVTFYCTSLHYYLEDWNRISLGSAQCSPETSFLQLPAKGGFLLSSNFYLRKCVKFTFANKIEAMYRTSHVNVKVEPRSNSRLSSTLYTSPLLYLRE